MPIDRVVINASTLITLFRAGLHPLLPHLFSELLVPEAVWNEVVSRTYDDPATRDLPQSAWARKTANTVDPAVAVWNLGAGETAVLSLSLHSPGYTAIVDDRAARRCARVLDVRTIDTAGVIVLARRKGLFEKSNHRPPWLHRPSIQYRQPSHVGSAMIAHLHARGLQVGAGSGR